MPRRRLEKKTERLLERFLKHLAMKKGISAETASEHAQRVELFALHYLGDYRGKKVLDASGSDIEEYLGDWYIRKVLNSAKSDVRPYTRRFQEILQIPL